MNQIIQKIFSFLFILIALIGCKTVVKPIPQTVEAPVVKQDTIIPRKASEKAIMYRTNKNYFNLVPVELSVDKKEVISFPDPKNLMVESVFPAPFPFAGGYFLDFAGIGLNVAFLKLTYEEYSKLEKTPDPKELYNLILDKDPLIEMCDCGRKSDYPSPIILSFINLTDSGLVRTRCKILK